VLRLAANLSTMFREWPLLERFAIAAHVGFRAVELQFPYEATAGAIAEAIAERLELVLINAPAGSLAEGERGLAIEGGARFEASVRTAQRYAQLTGCGHVHILIGRVPDGSRGQVLRRTVRHLRWAADQLGQDGIVVLLEALNPHDQPGYALASLHEAEQLRQLIGRSNVRLLFDAYHVMRTGGSASTEFRRFRDVIGHVQISGLAGRGEPDEPAMAAFLDDLNRIGYDGYVGCEYNARNTTLAGLGWAARFGIDANAA
jgi:hydroxypyruvate isomerase